MSEVIAWKTLSNWQCTCIVVTMGEEDYEATMGNLAEAICVAALKASGCEVAL